MAINNTLIGVYFLLFVVLIIFTIYFYSRYLLIPQTPSDIQQRDPLLVKCNPDDVLDAWIRNFANNPACPEFTNNFVVSGENPGQKMFEKFFLVSTDPSCCWFSNEQNERSIVRNPFICIGNTELDPNPYTLNQLNDSIYFVNGNRTVIEVPFCDRQPDCIGMVKLNDINNGNAFYRVYTYQNDSTVIITDPNQPLPPPDSSAYIAQNALIELSPDCTRAVRVIDEITGTVLCEQFNGQLICDASNQGILDDISNISNVTRFYPVAGANIPLSEALRKD